MLNNISRALVVSYSEFRERRERRLRVAGDAAYGVERPRPWWLEGTEETAMAAAMNGTIKRLVSDKGFGFIVADDGNEYFFHNSACTNARFDDLREGQAVTFERGQGPKGPRGENVKVVSRNG